jgi:hypothetical protein
MLRRVYRELDKRREKEERWSEGEGEKVYR